MSCPFAGTDEIEYVGREKPVAEPEYVFDNPASSAPKVPVSYLQEICTRKAMKAEYELLSSDGPVHSPTFSMRVSVGDLSAIGQEKTKQKAKHVAALNLLEHIVSVGRYTEFGIGGTEEEATKTIKNLSGVTPDSAAASATNPTNAVGKLQEFCQKRGWSVPAYELIKEDGPPHKRTFFIKAMVRQYSAEGTGNTKQLAKTDAAIRLLKVLENLPPEEKSENVQSVEGKEQEEVIISGQNDFRPPLAESNVGGLTLAEILASAETVGLKKLRGRTFDNEKPNAEHVSLLQRIFDEEAWKIEFYDMPRRSAKGEYQCLVQLSAEPVAVCYGRGVTPDDARQAAALNALEYLKMMTNS